MTNLITCRAISTWLTAAIIAIPTWSHAVTIVSGPYFTPAANAPLAGALQLTTDADSRISVLVSDGTGIWERDFYDYTTNHSETLLGFKPDQTNLIQVTVYDKDRNAYTAPQLLAFVTAPLPTNFPTYTVLTDEPTMMEPGYMLAVINLAYVITGDIVIMDNSGNVVWYCPTPTSGSGYNDVRQLDNGDLFLQLAPPVNEFIEMNMLGEIVRTWQPPAQYPINIHEGLVTSHDTIMYLSDTSNRVSEFPSSDLIPDPPLITTNIDDNPIVEISFTNSALLNVWSPLTNGLIDPTRVTYLTYGEFSGSPYGVDTEHANALIDDTNDNSIILSMRDQNAVVKFSRSTGKVKWILGPPALWGTNWQPYLLTPVGTPFNWNYGQHAPELTPEGTLLLYNDNPYQASPFDATVEDQSNYSSAVEYSIDETNMTVSEVWNSAWQTNQDRLYTPVVGRAQWLPQTRNVLVTYGYITDQNGARPDLDATNAEMVRLIEYTHDPVPQVVFDVSFFDYGDSNPDYLGYTCYRGYQIPDLYAHPAEPVTDITVSVENQIPLLEFSADPTLSYVVQASSDLTNWMTIGTPIQEDSVGDYDFEDLQASQYTTRFYRVVTQ
jgi:arylsulfate sulfotransferase